MCQVLKAVELTTNKQTKQNQPTNRQENHGGLQNETTKSNDLHLLCTVVGATPLANTSCTIQGSELLSELERMLTYKVVVTTRIIDSIMRPVMKLVLLQLPVICES